MNDWYTEKLPDIVNNQDCFISIRLINRESGEMKLVYVSYELLFKLSDLNTLGGEV